MPRILSFDRRAERTAGATRQQLEAMQRSIDQCRRRLIKKRRAVEESCKVLYFTRAKLSGATGLLAQPV